MRRPLKIDEFHSVDAEPLENPIRELEACRDKLLGRRQRYDQQLYKSIALSAQVAALIGGNTLEWAAFRAQGYWAGRKKCPPKEAPYFQKRLRLVLRFVLVAENGNDDKYVYKYAQAVANIIRSGTSISEIERSLTNEMGIEKAASVSRKGKNVNFTNVPGYTTFDSSNPDLHPGDDEIAERKQNLRSIRNSGAVIKAPEPSPTKLNRKRQPNVRLMYAKPSIRKKLQTIPSGSRVVISAIRNPPSKKFLFRVTEVRLRKTR